MDYLMGHDRLATNYMRHVYPRGYNPLRSIVGESGDRYKKPLVTDEDIARAVTYAAMHIDPNAEKLDINALVEAAKKGEGLPEELEQREKS